MKQWDNATLQVADNFVQKYKHLNKNIAIDYLQQQIIEKNINCRLFTTHLKKAKIKIDNQIAKILTEYSPQAIKYINKPSRAICIKAILKDPSVIELVPQDAFLCNLAMNKEITTYPLIKDNLKTYSHYLKYENREKELKEILSEIANHRNLPKDVLFFNNDNFVFGVEFEFMTTKPIFELYLLLKEFVNIKIQSSKTNKGQQWVLTKESSDFNTYEISSKKLHSNNLLELYKVCTVMTTLEKFSHIKILPNVCGLHIHIDCAKKKYKDLIKYVTNYFYLQPAINKLVATERKNNPFCKILTSSIIEHMSDFGKLEHTIYEKLQKNKNYTVNPYAYFYHKSIEFRQHESVFGFTDVVYWIHAIRAIMNIKNQNSYIFFLDNLYDILNLKKKINKHYTDKYIK